MTVSRFGGLWGACFGNLTLWRRTKHYCQCAFPGWCSITKDDIFQISMSLTNTISL